MDHHRQRNGQLDRVAAVAKPAEELDLMLEPAQEQFDLPPPQLHLDHLSHAQIPALGDEVIGGRGGALPASTGGRCDRGGDQAQPRQDRSRPVGGTAQDDPLIGLDRARPAVEPWHRRLDGKVRRDLDGGLAVQAADELDRSGAQAGEAGMGGVAEIDDQGAAGQARQPVRVVEEQGSKPWPSLARVSVTTSCATRSKAGASSVCTRTPGWSLPPVDGSHGTSPSANRRKVRSRTRNVAGIAGPGRTPAARTRARRVGTSPLKSAAGRRRRESASWLKLIPLRSGSGVANPARVTQPGAVGKGEELVRRLS